MLLPIDSLRNSERLVGNFCERLQQGASGWAIIDMKVSERYY